MTNFQLTDAQRQAIEEHGERLVYILDGVTSTSYVLMKADQFDRVKALLIVDNLDPRETYAAVDQAFREGWDDPAMDVYEDD